MKPIKRIAAFFIAILVVTALCGCEAKEGKTYKQAMDLMAEENYSEAYPLLASIQEYKDASIQLGLCKKGIIIDACKQLAKREYDTYSWALSSAGLSKPSPPEYSPKLEFNDGTGEFTCDMVLSFSWSGTNPKFYYRYYGVLEESTATITKTEDLN